jgi:hypothetical protein
VGVCGRREDPPRGACGNVRRVPEASFGLSNRASTWTVSPAGGTDETSDFIVDDAISAATEVVRRCGADKSDHRHCPDTFGADLKGWAFLTGDPAAIRYIIRRYGVFAAKNTKGEVDHTFLTSIVDRNSMLRVQYLGVRFDPDEFRRDLLSLVKEP